MPSQDSASRFGLTVGAEGDGLQRGFDEVDEVWGLSARGVAAMTEANGRHPPQRRFGALASPLGKARRNPVASVRALTGEALRISFVARRGESPQVPDRIGA